MADEDKGEYEKLEDTLDEVPMTWLPALFIHIARLCVEKKCFTDTGMETIVAKVKRDHDARSKR